VRYGGKVEECDMDGRGTPKRGEGPITHLLNELLYQKWIITSSCGERDMSSKWKIN
jgi:hypothetical protein